MTRTVKELQDKAIETNRTQWGFHRCSMCNYMCAYYWDAQKIVYDAGCDCVTYKDYRKTTWDSLAENYNQPHPEAFERNEREWGFISEGVNSDKNETR